jgi:hypothetical protein
MLHTQLSSSRLDGASDPWPSSTSSLPIQPTISPNPDLSHLPYLKRTSACSRRLSHEASRFFRQVSRGTREDRMFLLVQSHMPPGPVHPCERSQDPQHNLNAHQSADSQVSETLTRRNECSCENWWYRLVGQPYQTRKLANGPPNSSIVCAAGGGPAGGSSGDSAPATPQTGIEKHQTRRVTMLTDTLNSTLGLVI